ncbi:MAG: hypothetical protein KIT43_14340 [Bauldia sp.]|nr:hypothetical protein [Bauldia sp.]
MLHDPRLDRRSIATAVAVPAPPLTRRPRRRIAWQKPLLVVTLVLVALVAAAVALIALAASRNFELPFIRAQLAGMIEGTLGAGYDATVGSAVLDTDPVLGLVLRVGDIRVVDTNGAELLRVGSSLIAIDPTAIVTPKAVLRSVEIDGLWLSLVRSGSAIRLGNLETPALAATRARALSGATGLGLLAQPIEALDRSLAEVLAFAGRSGFERIGLYDAEVDLWRVGSAAPQHFARTEVTFAADPAAGRLSASLSASGYSGRWSVSAERSVSVSNGSRTLSLAFSQLTMADLLGPAAGSNIPFYGRGMVRLDAAGTLQGAQATVNLGSGTFVLGPKSVPIGVDEATVELRWDVARDRIFIEPSRFDFGPSYIVLAGTVGSEAAGGGLAFDIGSVNAVLAPRDSPSPPLPVDSMRLRGAADLEAGLIRIDQFSIATPYGSFDAAGSIGLEPLSPSIALAATFSEMPVWALKQLWPAGFQDGGRRWLIDNMLDGRITGGEVTAAIPAGALASGSPIPADMLRVQLSLADVTFRTMDGMPDVTGAHGVAVLSGSSLGIDIEQGRIVAPGGGIVEITAAAFAIPETATAVPIARLEATTTGAASAYGAIADSPPLYALQPFEMPPDALHGNGSARISATWPLVEGMTIDEVQWRIVMDLTGLSADRPLAGRTVANGDVNLDITPSVVLVTGEATVDGVPANVDFAFPLLPDVNGRQQIRLVLDEAGRARLGFDLEGFLGGTVFAHVTDLAPAETGQHYEIDLGPARVSMPQLGWTKGAGVPATMSFDIIEVPTGYHVRNLRLVGDGFGLAGEADLDADYGLIRAAITDFALRRADDVDAVITRNGNSWRAILNGSSLDIRGLIAEGLDQIDDLGGGEGETPDMRFSGHFGQLIGFNGELIRDASFEFVSERGEMRRLEIEGTLNGQPVSLVYSRPGIVTGVEGYIGDAGAALRFMNFYTHIQGGVIRLNGLEYADGAIRGNAELSNFHIVDEPGLARLMMPPDDETAQPADAVPFERLAFSYMQLDSRVTVDEVVLRGGQMGAIGAGWFDFAAGTLNIAGTYIPAYAFNNLFARIPVLGIALGGGAEEGLFGLTFRVFGEIAQPQMEVNPLSAIAPGIFRKIFQFQ